MWNGRRKGGICTLTKLRGIQQRSIIICFLKKTINTKVARDNEGNEMSQNKIGTEMKKPLGLMGVTMNAMALIAPGAFLWITYQIQAAQKDPVGAATAADM